MLYHTNRNPHGGDVYGAAVQLDFSSSLHPLGTPPRVLRAMQDAARLVRQYPDPYCRALTAAIARHESVSTRQILCGAGAAELIYAYCDALRPQRAAVLAPTFSEYAAAAGHFGAQIVRCPLCPPDFLPDESLLPFLEEQKPDVLFLCTPNNPTGRTIPRALLGQILGVCAKQHTRVLLDECFLDFTDEKSAKDLLPQIPELLILKAFTKTHALAGARVGYCLTDDEALLEKMAQATQPWNVSVFAQAAGLAALEEEDWVARAKPLLSRERSFLTGQLAALGFSVTPSEANYLLFHGHAGLDDALAHEGILIRSCEKEPGLGAGWYRIAVRLREENEALLAAIRRVKEDGVWR